MCSNFEPATLKQLKATFDNQLELDLSYNVLSSYQSHVYPKDFCPIIIASESGLQVVRGQFGLSPAWASNPVDYSTYNARLETIENKKTFEPPFTKNQFCLVPMQAFFEPYYLNSNGEKTSKNHWQRIFRKDDAAFTIAGMFEFNSHFSEPVYSFTLLTHNADSEDFMQRFHRPEKEKRSISLVEAADREAYLQANHEQLTKLMANINGDDFDYKGSE